MTGLIPLDERFEDFEVAGTQRHFHFAEKYFVEFFEQFDLLAKPLVLKSARGGPSSIIHKFVSQSMAQLLQPPMSSGEAKLGQSF
jgi:hypothetical protein